MDTQRNVASFVVRFVQDLWQDENGEPRIQWLGRIQHVQGEDEKPFTNFAEAVEFIQRHLTQLTLDAIPGEIKMDQDKLINESLKMWEQFASSYSEMMFQGMERTINQSQAIRDQMEEAIEKAMKTWRRQTHSSQDKTGEILKELQDQIQELTTKVNQLESALKKQQEDS